ncbi:MAG TPA: c-type cytochrome, partial [Steroidobacteraceae bacterium]|nr:c-type cytochrome [Steroidobacteraceae bacterium]
DTGEKLWESPTVSVPVAGPITYTVRGKQYIAVNAGWNNAIVHGLNDGPEPFSVGPAKLVVYALDAKGKTLPPAPAPEAVSPPPRAEQPVEKVRAGEVVFAQFCSTCHGRDAIGAGARDLRFIKPQSHTDFSEIVLGGKFKEKGMAPFNGVLTPEQVDAVHAYVIARGQEDWQPVFGPPPPRR